MKLQSLIRHCAVVLLGLGILSGHTLAQAETTLERIKRTGVIRIGYANETPFAYTEANGNVTGESPEIVKKVAAGLGIKKVEGVLTEWGALIPGLMAGRFDVIAAGMYITPARSQQVLFTDPHYQLPDTLLVPPGNPKKLDSYASIAKDPSLKLAIMAGTAEVAYAKKAGVTESQILLVPDTVAQLQAVLTQRADATVGTQLTMKDLAKKSNNRAEAVVGFKDDPANIGYGALAFRKEDKDLRDAFNKELQAWLGSEDHLKTVAPFGFDRSNVTTKKAAELAK